MSDAGRGSTVLDLLLVSTGRHDLYPASTGRRRFGTDDWKTLQARWRTWLEGNRDRLHWNPEERRFDVK